MKNDKQLTFRLPAAYKEYIDLYSCRIGLTTAKYLNELIRRDIEKKVLDFSNRGDELNSFREIYKKYKAKEEAFFKHLKDYKEAAV